jgi:hypothetical protein
MGPGSWNRRVRPAASPDCPFANRSPGLFWMFWLFLQPNNSQLSNCQNRNTKISTRVRDPHARNPGEAPDRFFQSRLCHLFHLFYQVHIRPGSLRSSAGCFAICTQMTAIAPTRPIAQRSPSALSRNSMRREHCGNFSVAHIVMNAEVLQRFGRYPRPAGRRVARCFHTRGGTVVRWSRTAAQVSLAIAPDPGPGKAHSCERSDRCGSGQAAPARSERHASRRWHRPCWHWSNPSITGAMVAIQLCWLVWSGGLGLD